MNNRFILLGTLLSVLCFSLFSTCKKDDEDEPYDIPVEISNYSNEVVYFYADGEYKEMIPAGKVNNYVFTTKNGNSVKFEVKSKSGVALHSKTVGRGGSYVAEISAWNSNSNDSEYNPNNQGNTVTNNTNLTFTINKIVLNKWRANNLFDNPDPWFRILNKDEFVGRTKYYSDRKDGTSLTWLDLDITIKDIYSSVTFALYDYDLSYSTSGSSFISGIVCENFASLRGRFSFDLSTDKMSITVYGTWK